MKSRNELNPYFGGHKGSEGSKAKPTGFKNPKANGSKARLTNGNPLAFNQYKLRQRSDLMQANTNEGSFDYKLAPNPKNAPPNSNSQGTLNGQLKYWKGQKLLPGDETCCLGANLKEAGYVLAQIEQIKFTQIGRKSNLKQSEHRKHHDYFSSSSTRWAFCSFLFKKYYENRCLTKMEVTSHLGISSKATLQLVKYCEEHELLIWEHGKCYWATKLFSHIYMEYIRMQTDTLMPLWAKMSVFMAASQHLVNDLKNGK